MRFQQFARTNDTGPFFPNEGARMPPAAEGNWEGKYRKSSLKLRKISSVPNFGATNFFMKIRNVKMSKIRF
jgi:hypothetical protein